VARKRLVDARPEPVDTGHIELALKSDAGAAVGVQHIANGGFHVTRHTCPLHPPGARPTVAHRPYPVNRPSTTGQDVEREAPLNHHRRRRRLGGLRAPRGPTRAVGYHHRGPVRHRRRGTDRDRRGVGVPLTDDGTERHLCRDRCRCRPSPREENTCMAGVNDSGWRRLSSVSRPAAWRRLGWHRRRRVSAVRPSTWTVRCTGRWAPQPTCPGRCTGPLVGCHLRVLRCSAQPRGSGVG
jgi:hypothetical protein